MCSTCSTWLTICFPALHMSTHMGQFCNPKFSTSVHTSASLKSLHNSWKLPMDSDLSLTHIITHTPHHTRSARITSPSGLWVKDEALNLKPCALIARTQSSQLSHLQYENQSAANPCTNTTITGLDRTHPEGV